jgi:hypothetical protein
MNHTRENCVAAHIYALLLATLTSAAALVAYAPWMLAIFPAVLGFTLGHTLLLGFPLYLFARAVFRRWINAVSAVLIGFIIGVVPLNLLTIDRLYFISHNPTVRSVLDILILGVAGALGGFVFWLTLRRSGCLPSRGSTVRATRADTAFPSRPAE